MKLTLYSNPDSLYWPMEIGNKNFTLGVHDYWTVTDSNLPHMSGQANTYVYTQTSDYRNICISLCVYLYLYESRHKCKFLHL